VSTRTPIFAQAKIAIIGAGLMGTGLARLFRRVNWPVSAWDQDPRALARLCQDVPGAAAAKNLESAVKDADLVIEAVAEKPSIKQTLFAQLAAHTTPHTLLATNSSVIPVAVVAADVSEDEAGRVLGTHFWNPPDLIPLVEVIQGPRTSEVSIQRAIDLLESAGREPVRVHADVVPGNRLQHALWREAMALVDEGICSPQDVDRIIKRSFGARLAVLGPLENADLVGLELTRQIHEVVLPTLSGATRPSAGLLERIAAGHTGIASGGGFYSEWDEAKIAALRSRLAAHLRKSFPAGEN
jgi:3-hydroxybutyryl-CoA dehydrogenase